ncbi:MAG TPA: hypothetical protein VGM78_13665 [Ilumatobacteraceae bacterium]|jgi:hypothetical protein
MVGDDTDGMGYNPHRRRVPKRGDLAIVITAIAVAIALVLWALLA